VEHLDREVLERLDVSKRLRRDSQSRRRASPANELLSSAIRLGAAAHLAAGRRPVSALG